MKYKVIKTLYDPFTKRMIEKGTEIEIDNKYVKLYGDRVRAINSKKAVK